MRKVPLNDILRIFDSFWKIITLQLNLVNKVCFTKLLSSLYLFFSCSFSKTVKFKHSCWNILFGFCKGVFVIPFYSTSNKENNTIKFLLKADNKNRIVGVIAEKRWSCVINSTQKLVLFIRKISLMYIENIIFFIKNN